MQDGIEDGRVEAWEGVGSLWTPRFMVSCASQTLLLATGGPHWGQGPQNPFASLAPLPKWGHLLPAASALGTSTGKGPRLGRLPALVELVEGCRPDVGWAGLWLPACRF